MSEKLKAVDTLLEGLTRMVGVEKSLQEIDDFTDAYGNRGGVSTMLNAALWSFNAEAAMRFFCIHFPEEDVTINSYFDFTTGARMFQCSFCGDTELSRNRTTGEAQITIAEAVVSATLTHLRHVEVLKVAKK